MADGVEGGGGWRERYRVIEKLGEGGMGVVLRAEQLDLQREVALKVISANATHPDVARRFQREARAMSRVRHPALVRILDVGAGGAEPYIAMELVPGRSLEHEVQADPHGVRRRADDIVAVLLDAVAALHADGLVHRDLKPANVMMTPEGKPVVMDLGLARDFRGAWTEMTRPGELVGTPAYLAPEQLAGQDSGPRADVWALGAIYYYLHASMHPFRGQTLERLFLSITRDPLPDLEQSCPDMPERRRQFLLALLERDPGRRPADARVALEKFRQAPRSAPAPARRGPVQRPAVAAPPPRSRRGTLVATAIVLFAAAGWWGFARAPHAPVAAPASPVPAVDRGAVLARHAAAHARLQRWREFEPQLAALRRGGRPARELVHTLEPRSPLPISSDPRSWVFWIELGQWLDDPERAWGPARSPASVGLGALVQQQAALTGHLWLAECPTGPSVAAALAAVQDDPGEPASWLVLGLWLELEGAPQAVAAYARGLHLIGHGGLRPWLPLIVWRALARALQRVPGHDLQREWMQLSAGPENSWRAWFGLSASYDGASRGWLRSLIREAMDRRKDQEPAEVLALEQEERELDPQAAQLAAGIKPDGRADQPWLAWEFFLRRGRAREAGATNGSDWLGWLVADVPRAVALAAVQGASRASLRGAAALALTVEARDLPAARALSPLVVEGRVDEVQWWADQVRAGEQGPARAACRALLESGQPVWSELDVLAGDLGPPLELSWVQDALQARAERAAAPCDRLALALWHARAGRDAAAFAALDPVRGDPHVVQDHGEALLEILARPLWKRNERQTVPAAVLERCTTAAAPWAPHPDVAAYWRSLVQGDASATLAAARRMNDRLPRHPLTVLALAHAAASHDDRVRARTAARFNGMPLWVLDEITR